MTITTLAIKTYQLAARTLEECVIILLGGTPERFQDIRHTKRWGRQ